MTIPFAVHPPRGAAFPEVRAVSDAVRTLSALQQGMLFSTLLQPGAGVDVQQLVFRLREPLDAARLAACWQAATDRHEILRTSFRWQGVDAPEQVVWTGVAAPFDVLPWEGDDAFAAWLRADRVRGFAMDQAPLHRAALFARAADDWTLVWTFHHALLDGRGQQLILRALFAEYDADVVPGAEQPFRDYLDWLNAHDTGASEGFWRELLADAPASTPLPGAPSSAESATEFSQRTVAVDAAPLQARADAHRVSLNALVHAAWGIVLARHAGADDVLWGATRAARRTAGAEDVVGIVINTVPARLRLAPETTLLDAVRSVARQWSAVRPHEHTPPQRIQEWCGAAGGRLFETIAVFDVATQAEQMRGWGGGWAHRDMHILRKPSTPLALSGYGGPAVRLTLTYDPARFSADAVDRLLAHLRAVLLAFAADPARRVADLPLLADDEAARLAAWADGGASSSTGIPVHIRFARAAAAAPDAPAVADEARSLAYGALDARANRLARHLRGLGVAGESRVAILAHRGVDAVTAQLATLKAGGAFVPLDVAYPAERIEFVLADCGARVLLAHRAVADRIPADAAARIVWLDDEAWAGESADALADEARAEQAAYVVYTSGSTGRPKGVVVEHRALANLCAWHVDAFGVTAQDRAGQLAGAGFDAAVWEVFPYLAAGAALRVVGDDVRGDAAALRNLVLAERLTILFLPTPLVDGFLSQAWPADTLLRTVLAGGDALRVRPSERHPFRLVNNYGPTENGVVSTSGAVSIDGTGAPTIGRPVAGTRAYVLDARLRPAPLGAPGELYVAGASLARGYHGRADLTAERFIPEPFGADAGARMYATGDRVRWTEAGELEFLGRTDFQVKVRGFRIEPGEIEAALLADAAVREAVVLAIGEGEGKRLAAYVAGDSVDTDALRMALRARLPEYMVPAAFVVMDRLPLNANGKIDRRALPAPAWDADSAAEAAATPTEGVVASLWAQVLGADRVGATDDFFALGGHSLLAARAVARLSEAFGVELPLRALFEASTVRGLATLIDAARAGGAVAAPPIVPLTDRGTLPVSFAQERLWVLDQVEPDRAAYVVPTALRLRGALDAMAMERALGEIVRRHETLRTAFRAESAGPVAVLVDVDSVLSREDLSHLPPAEREAALTRRAADEAERVFDLAAGPLHRFTLVRLADDDHALLLTFHHAVTDGWSVGVVMRELSALYAAFAQGADSPLGPPPVQYADFAAWQRAWLTGGVLDRELAWWTERLAGAPELLELPTDRPRPPARTGRGARLRTLLPAEVAEGVEALARAEGSTPYMVLMAAFQAFVARYSGQDDVVVGSPIAGRTRPEVQELAGFFVNTLALRARVDDDPSFVRLLARTREETLGAFAHQELPFEKLVEALRPERTTSHSPVFQVMLALQPEGDDAPHLPGIDASLLPRELATAKFDLFLALRRTRDGLAATLEYATDLWDASTAARMLEHFGILLAGAVARPERAVSALPLLDAAERARVMDGFAGPRVEIPAGECIHDLFQAQVRATPDAAALWHEGRTTTYARLNARANQVARRLRALGVTPETVVGVCLRRTPELVAAILGVLKAGGAYLPLDPAYPAERVAYMLGDSGARVLLTESTLIDYLGGGIDAIALDADGETDAQETADLPAAAVPENLAYLIYTSGSTGRPKGVQIEHRRTVTFLRWLREAFRPEDRRSVLGGTSVCFDVSIAEIFGTLSWGGRLVLVENAIALATLPADVEVQTAPMVPSAAAELVRMGGIPSCVRVMDLGGEPVPPALASALYALPHIDRVVNLYGPTEDTTYSTWHVIERDAERVMVGRPAANTRMRVLDARLQPVPVGMRGELYIAGEKLARGYHARPALTAERFVPDPHGAPGSRMYRVMDLVRWRRDGALECLGRTDFQVKVRGFRVEPGEIESALREHPAVADAAVIAADDAEGQKRLAAYIVAADGLDVDAEALRAHLRGRLPEYMVPSAIAFLADLPRTPNGKTDRRALPAPEWGGGARASAPPQGALQEAVAAVVAGVLGIDSVGADDDFFALGGHSLLATRVVVRMREGYSIELPLRAVFEAPTVAGLAARIAEDPAAAAQVEQVWEMMQMLAGLSEEQVAELMATQVEAGQ
jgi:amino acid adenylation domain-containing protein